MISMIDLESLYYVSEEHRARFSEAVQKNSLARIDRDYCARYYLQTVDGVVWDACKKIKDIGFDAVRREVFGLAKRDLFDLSWHLFWGRGEINLRQILNGFDDQWTAAVITAIKILKQV